LAFEEVTADKQTAEMLEKAKKAGIKTVFDRFQEQQPQCGFGLLGPCCRICNMGPCRIDPFGEGPQLGTCGATVETIVARNLLRMAAGGTAAHTEHARHTAQVLREATEGKVPYSVKDPKKAEYVARKLGISTEGKTPSAITKEITEIALTDFVSLKDQIMHYMKVYFPTRIECWSRNDVYPRSPYRDIVEAMQRSTMGVDADYESLFLHTIRTGLSDGFSMLVATELQDILFGMPKPIRSKSNLGVLRKDMVNLIVHGHVPLLSEKVVDAARSDEMINLAKQAGTEGINVAGICCTGNEVLMRRGVPLAGNFLQQELAIITGAVDAMCVDVQCIMPSLVDVAGCFHTKIITTMPQGRIPGATHMAFVEEKADEVAKQIVKTAVENYRNRDKDRVHIPSENIEIMGGFSFETILHFLGGTLEPLSYATFVDGSVRGVVGLVGCNNPKVKHDYGHVRLAETLIKNDILVVGTGCWAYAAGKAGLLVPEAAAKASTKLRGVCRALGLPPCLHMGSCVDNSRILVAVSQWARDLNVDMCDLPVAAAAMEWMSEKATSIASCAIGMGALTVLGTVPQFYGSEKVSKLFCEEAAKKFGGKFMIESDPDKAAEIIINHVEDKRGKIGLKS